MNLKVGDSTCIGDHEWGVQSQTGLPTDGENFKYAYVYDSHVCNVYDAHVCMMHSVYDARVYDQIIIL